MIALLIGLLIANLISAGRMFYTYLNDEAFGYRIWLGLTNLVAAVMCLVCIPMV